MHYQNKGKVNMIKLKNKQDCCGCSACEQICSVNAITLKADVQGFLYPSIDTKKCVLCRRCLKACPITSPKAEKIFEQDAYLVQHKNSAILEDSTSGGSFTAIAQAILTRGGVVFGAAYDKHFNVYHTFVEDEKELARFRNSKYVQSKMGQVFQQVKHFLKEKRYVCFSGTPCQIEGLLNYLNQPSPYLFTVDVVCHAVPSPAVWQTYLGMLRKQQKTDFLNLRFRDKDRFGYMYSQFAVKLSNEKTIYEGIERNIMMRAFFSEICNRPSCYDCKFKKQHRRSDITIWDCFDLNEFSQNKAFKQDKGISRMLVHSDAGKSLMNDVLKNCIYEKITVSNAMHYDAKEMISSVKKNPQYDAFWSDFEKNPEETLRKYFPFGLKQKLEMNIRQITFRIGLYTTMRSLYKNLFGNRKR